MHKARLVPFDDLHGALEEAKAKKLVSEQVNGDLRLYCYTRSCAYDRAWDDTTILARGLILDVQAKEVRATPFPKFFNVGERGDTIPDLAFETFEKLDGSLIILFWHEGWQAATKGSFRSDQAQWAADQLKRYDLSLLDEGVTYLLEAVYPENRIVVHYTDPGLILLAAYEEDGGEWDYRTLTALGKEIGWRCAARYPFESISDLLAKAKTLPPSEEGFVLRFIDGTRLKIKGDEYRRIHALISRVTPLAMWETMLAGDDLEDVRRQLPEEFWGDFDQITIVLDSKVRAIVAAAEAEAATVAHLSDKDVGLHLDKFSPSIRPFIFPYRKHGDLLSGKSRAPLFRSIRPTANQLEGYTPSYAMNRVLDDDA